MSKIICDVCGTRYPESADACPICGCVRAGGGKTVADDIVMDEARPAAAGSHVKGGRFSKSNVRKRNQGMVSYEEAEERPRPKAPAPQEQADEAYGYNEPPRKQKSNVVLNVLLVIVIVALLCVSAYIFVEYFLPGILVQDVVPETTEYVPTTEAPTEPEITEEPTVPCTGLEWADGDDLVILEGEGHSWLLNVAVSPVDTTDELVYYSSDESVVVVDSEGCLTAVGEGEAVVVVACGDIQLQCEVVCAFAEEEESTVEPTGEEGEEATEAGDEGEDATEGPTEPLKDVKLEANYTDISLTAYGQQFTFKLTGLSNDEVTWESDNESIVTVDNGTVTRVGKGTANITVTYGDQELTIVVRCK